MVQDELSGAAEKKAGNLVRDARMAVTVGLIPILGLVFILRLVQWYLLKNKYPALATSSTQLASDFRSSLHRLWFAVLFWPILVLFLVLYFSLT